MCKFGQSTSCMGCGWIGVWGGWVGGCVSISIARRKFLMFSCEGPPWLRVQVLGVGPGYMDERIRPYNRHVTQHRQVEETKPEGSGRSTGVTPFTLARLHVPCPLLVQFVWVIIIFLFVSSCSSCFSCFIHILLSLCLFLQEGHYYSSMWRAAIEARPDAITINSFNDWGHGARTCTAAACRVCARTGGGLRG